MAKNSKMAPHIAEFFAWGGVGERLLLPPPCNAHLYIYHLRQWVLFKVVFLLLILDVTLAEPLAEEALTEEQIEANQELIAQQAAEAKEIVSFINIVKTICYFF